MKKILGIIRLAGPVITLTAIADIWAGSAISISGAIPLSGASAFTGTDLLLKPNLIHLAILTLATIGLNAGGNVMNDNLDANLNRRSRPELPISSGLVSRNTAFLLAFVLMLAGIVAAFFAGLVSGFIALVIAFLILFYNVYGKHISVAGPVSMGLCRGANLLLGISFIPAAIGFNFMVILIPMIFIAAFTSLSPYEIQAGNRLALQLAGWLCTLVIGYLLYMSKLNDHFLPALPFIAVLFYLSLKPITVAFHLPNIKNVTSAFRWGRLSQVALNAALAACFMGFAPGIIILALLPVSIVLSRYFSLT